MGQYLMYVLLTLLVLFLLLFRDSDFKLKRATKYFKPLSVSINSILSTKFTYYKQLNSFEKERFIFRVKRFIVNKDFESRGELIVTDEMKILIAATAIQLTFGFPPIILKFFTKIIIYPTKYYSPMTKTKNIGEVNQRGIIVLSWDYFMKGLERPHDGLNVGLHEMSHALKLENAINNGEYGFLSSLFLGKLHKEAIKEMRRIRQGQNTFIRKYAATNQEEFFAVCIEYFFEKPKEFKYEIPILYQVLTQLLRQDPAKNM
jgi:Mlc titration factor MtfA (ptsG expression regulator)